MFSNDWPATRLGRNLGLAAMDNISPLKGPLVAPYARSWLRDKVENNDAKC